MTALISETRRVLAADAQTVNRFVHGFSAEIGVEFAGADWLHQFTVADMRNHVECAVFDLIQGCRCGRCTGISNGGAFWVEATYSVDGIKLTGYVAHALASAAFACAPPKSVDPDHPHAYQQKTPPHNVEFTCACGKPVITSLDHITEGKPPRCASCLAAEGARG